MACSEIENTDGELSLIHKLNTVELTSDMHCESTELDVSATKNFPQNDHEQSEEISNVIKDLLAADENKQKDAFGSRTANLHDEVVIDTADSNQQQEHSDSVVNDKQICVQTEGDLTLRFYLNILILL